MAGLSSERKEADMDETAQVSQAIPQGAPTNRSCGGSTHAHGGSLVLVRSEPGPTRARARAVFLYLLQPSSPLKL